ncbi:hypothetical protein TrCOL_g10063 [Triparma columacea]|uniref:Regulator of chromosome condensation 1/beta-lactamase-inhibitor protein II n=1 Tax=Triparma columacea TaxID=722753 RepID=A0A9W7L8A8_9STRA|nr:hypothetical protein TrCOL_g10063 [Triparma columacea]
MGHITTVSTRLATLTPSFPSKCPKASPLRNFSTKIYPFGSSFTGALGIGDKGLTTSLPKLTPKSVEFLQESTDPATGSVLVSPLPSSSSSHQQPTSVRCGWGHSVWTRDGDLFVAGKPHDFQTLLRMNRLPVFAVNLMNWMLTSFSVNVGVAEDDASTVAAGMMKTTPTRYDLPEGVRAGGKIAAGAGLTAFVCEQGKLYCFGLSAYGQCGSGTEVNNVWSPTPVLGLHSSLPPPPSATLPSDKKLENLTSIGQEGSIVDVGLGLQHGAAVDSLGNVYAWGKGERGQCGLWPDGGNTSYAGKVRLRRGRGYDEEVKVEGVECGMQHTAAITEDGEVYIWGKFQGGVDTQGSEGQAVDAFWPHRMVCGRSDSKVISIATASHQTAALMDDGSVWMNGIVKDGRGETVYDFVEVAGGEMWGGEEVEIFGGFQVVAVVGGKEAWVLELRETGRGEGGDGEGGEEGGEIDEAARWGNVERADFLDGWEGEGKIVDLSMGWKFGQAIVVRD